MPDARGNFRGFRPTPRTAEAWERVFGQNPSASGSKTCLCIWENGRPAAVNPRCPLCWEHVLEFYDD